MEFQRLFDLFHYQQAKYPNKIALACKQNLSWQQYSTDDCLAAIEQVSVGALKLGLVRGDKVALVTTHGSPAWNFLDFGLQQIGVITVTLHITLERKELLHVLKESGVRYCIVQNREHYDELQAVQSNVLNLKKVFSMEYLPDIPHWSLLQTTPTAKHLAEIQALKAVIHEDDLASIIYTAGTTGTPKGVMLSHKNIVHNVKAMLELIPLNCDKRVISFLSLSHAFERTINYAYIAAGVSLYYVPKLEQVSHYLKEVRPHYFTLTPFLLEQTYETLRKRADKLPKWFNRLYLWSIKVGTQFPDKKLSFFYWWKWQIASLVVFRHWRRLSGGKIEGILLGDASLMPKLNRLFTAAGFAVKTAYGLTEVSPLLTFNRFESGNWKTSTAGIPSSAISVKIENESNDASQVGEIWVKAKHIMLGYNQAADTTLSYTNEEGWFRTGDIGRMIQQRFLKIIDRTANVFETASGVYITPQSIENELCTNPFIKQCMVIGAQRPFLTALIVPNFSILSTWCLNNNIYWTARQDLLIEAKVEQYYDEILQDFNKDAAKHEQIQHYHLLDKPWSVANGLLSSNRHKKRPLIQAQFKRAIAEMYR